MSSVSMGEVNDRVLAATRSPQLPYFLVLGFLGAGILWGWLAWAYQLKTGMGAAGINHPVGWGTYIGNFVFWVGIAHSGTLISAILFLVRSKWRDAVSRAAETMTIFAIMTAGLFPLIHLGRVWVFYFILPYPSQREIWPNFLSPLVWDVLAVGTYFTVSLIFYYVGLIPDLAAARDQAEEDLGVYHWRAKLYRGLSLGWTGTAQQWRHYSRSYLFFAALATPLVISVHSIVSWDFAVSLLPGWHTTIYAPYFVAGAIHSGLAMVLTLVIPMRGLLNLKQIITRRHLELVAQTMLVTTAIMGYSYVVEVFIAWYSGNIFEQQFAAWRAFEWSHYGTYIYWSLFFLNVLVPLTLVCKKLRTNIVWLFSISILVNIGMWLERFHLVPASTQHDFLPHNWGHYFPSWVEISITAGSVSFFFFFVFVAAKLLPMVPMADFKTMQKEEEIPSPEPCRERIHPPTPGKEENILVAVFADAGSLLHAIKAVCNQGFRRVEIFSPLKLQHVEDLMRHSRSPVRYWTLAGALAGMIGGFALAAGTANVNELIVGGKPPFAPIPYCIVAFEGTILLGSIANLAGMIVHSGLFRRRRAPFYRRRFSRDKFGLLVSCPSAEVDRAVQTLRDFSPEETHVYP